MDTSSPLSWRLPAAVAAVALIPLTLAGQSAAPQNGRPIAGRPRTAVRVPAPTVATPTSLGERLYMRGLSTTGASVPATVESDVRVRSTDMACVNCHRRSGMGTAEGQLVVPVINGPALFAARTVGVPQLGEPRSTGQLTRRVRPGVRKVSHSPVA